MTVFRYFLVFFLILISTQINYGAKESRPPLDHVLSEISKYIDTYHGIFETPGAGIVVVKDGKVIMAKGCGTLSKEDKTPVDADTVFSLASGTKNFTATLIMKLVSEGKLSLDDKVAKYLPDFKLSSPETTQNLTIRHLLSHSVGLKNFAGDSLWHGRLSQQEVIEKMSLLPIENPLDTTYSYSNIFVGIAGLIIEKVTGEPYGTALHDELLSHLSMKDTSVGVESMAREVSLIDRIVGWISPLFGGTEPRKHAKQHALKNGKAHPLSYYSEFYLFPGSSGVNSTLNDLGKWLIFQLNNKDAQGKILLSQELMAQMRHGYVDGTKILHGQQFPRERIQKVTLGLGWFNYDYGVDKNRVQVHTQMGGINGSRSLLTIVPEENLGIAVVGNIGGMRASLLPEAITQKFLDLYLGINDGIDWAQKIREKFLSVQANIKRSFDAMRLKNPRKAADLKLYTGTFDNEIYGTIEVKEDNNQLVVLYRGYTIRLEHWNGDFFRFHGNELSEGYAYDDLGVVEFGFDASGKAFGLVISSLDEGTNPTFIKKS